MKKEIVLDKSNYVARDISWLYFNYRILKEAQKEEVPLYERLSFLGIYSNNLDEFYRVRVAKLLRLANSSFKGHKKIKEETKETLDRINELTNEYSKEFEKTQKDVFNALKNYGIYLLDEESVNEEEKAYLKDYFIKNIYGYINPIMINKNSNLSFINDSHIYLAILLINSETKKEAYSIIALPVSKCGRFIKLPNFNKEKHNHSYIYLDDVVRLNLDYIFKTLNYDKFKAYAFKFSKDAELEIESDPEEGILDTLTEAVKGRKLNTPTRVVFGVGIPKSFKKELIKRLKIKDTDFISESSKYHNNKDLMDFIKEEELIGKLSYLKWEPLTKRIENSNQSIIKDILNKDQLLHVPYESFDYLINLVKECSISSEVKEIKSSIYRVNNDSKMIKTLLNAVENGKKVTCIVELFARFNEASNISISKILKDGGVNVLTKNEVFKIHGKLIYIKLKNKPDIAVISTGNFHENNAKTYTDCLLFTANPKIVNEVRNIFDYVELPYEHYTFRNLLVSPINMYSTLARLTKKEIENAKNGLPSEIKIKVNHITDPKIIELFYKAYLKGVKIKLLVRGNCSIIKNEKYAKNIEIHGIIDRYLEHSRIFIFSNNNDPLYYIGSADLMPRNLYNRIEVLAPIYDNDIKKELDLIVDYGFKDNDKSVIVTGNNTYLKYSNDENLFRSQEELYNYYKLKDK